MTMARQYHELYMSVLHGGLAPVTQDEEAA
jgi:hypothetical protein